MKKLYIGAYEPLKDVCRCFAFTIRKNNTVIARVHNIYVIVKSHYEEVIVVITRVQGGAKDECNNNDNLRVQWD